MILDVETTKALLQTGFSMFVAAYLLVKTSKESHDLHDAIVDLTAWLKAKEAK